MVFGLPEEGVRRNPNDTDEYYKIDFSKLPNVTLNNKEVKDEANIENEEFYFICPKTLTVYYSKGVLVDNLNTDNGSAKVFYTLPSNYENIKTVNVTQYN